MQANAPASPSLDHRREPGHAPVTDRSPKGDNVGRRPDIKKHAINADRFARIASPKLTAALSRALQTGSGSREQAKALESLEMQRQIVGRLNHTWLVDTNTGGTTDTGKVRTEAMAYGWFDGGEAQTVVVDSREHVYNIHPKKLREQLNQCHRGSTVMLSGGRFVERPHACNQAFCPVCVRYRGKVQANRWVEVINQLGHDGYQPVFMTLTQGNDRSQWGSAEWVKYSQGLYDGRVALTPYERKVLSGYAGHAPEQEYRPTFEDTPQSADSGGTPTGWDFANPATAVQGETLFAARARFLQAFEGLRKDRSTRDWWKRNVAGYILGLEWTGRYNCPCRRCQVVTGRTDKGTPIYARAATQPHSRLRWHVHGHIVAVLHPEVNPETFQHELRAAWALKTAHAGGGNEAYGARGRAQDVQVLTPETVQTKVRQCLKYPFKPAELTKAQLLEALAATKGTKNQQVGGCFHGSMRVSAAAQSLAQHLYDVVPPEHFRRTGNGRTLFDDGADGGPLDTLTRWVEHIWTTACGELSGRTFGGERPPVDLVDELATRLARDSQHAAMLHSLVRLQRTAAAHHASAAHRHACAATAMAKGQEEKAAKQTEKARAQELKAAACLRTIRQARALFASLAAALLPRLLEEPPALLLRDLHPHEAPDHMSALQGMAAVTTEWLGSAPTTAAVYVWAPAPPNVEGVEIVERRGTELPKMTGEAVPRYATERHRLLKRRPDEETAPRDLYRVGTVSDVLSHLQALPSDKPPAI